MRGLASTIGYLLALLMGVLVVLAVGSHLLLSERDVRLHVVTVASVEVVRGPNDYTVNMLVENHGTEPVTIASILVTSGEASLVFGDNGTEDGLTGLRDIFEPVVIDPGASMLIGAYHEVPDGFTLPSQVVVIVRYKYPGWSEPYEAGTATTILQQAG